MRGTGEQVGMLLWALAAPACHLRLRAWDACVARALPDMSFLTLLLLLRPLLLLCSVLCLRRSICPLHCCLRPLLLLSAC